MLAPVIEPPSAPQLPPPEYGQVPPDFVWTPAEQQKITALARLLYCREDVARQVLVYFLRYIHEHQRGLAVAQLPQVLSGFPIKWGYKRKRNDFLKLLHQLDLIYVKINFRPKVRAKTYALARAGLELMGRMPRPAAPAANESDQNGGPASAPQTN